MWFFSAPGPIEIITEKPALRQRQFPAVDYAGEVFQFSFTGPYLQMDYAPAFFWLLTNLLADVDWGQPEKQLQVEGL